MIRSFRMVGSPFILPPGVPEERVETLRRAFRRVFNDPRFMKAWKRLTGEDAYPWMSEEQEKAIREIPRGPEVVVLFKKIAAAGPLPGR